MHLQITARPDATLIATSVRRRLRTTLWSARSAGWLAIALSALLGGFHPLLLAGGLLLAVALHGHGKVCRLGV
jgi:hypothetical protein